MKANFSIIVLVLMRLEWCFSFKLNRVTGDSKTALAVGDVFHNGEFVHHGVAVILKEKVILAGSEHFEDNPRDVFVNFGNGDHIQKRGIDQIHKIKQNDYYWTFAKLKDSLVFNEYVQAATLPPGDYEENKTQTGTIYTSCYYNSTIEIEQVKIISTKECQAIYRREVPDKKISDSMFCITPFDYSKKKQYIEGSLVFQNGYLIGLTHSTAPTSNVPTLVNRMADNLQSVQMAITLLGG